MSSCATHRLHRSPLIVVMSQLLLYCRWTSTEVWPCPDKIFCTGGEGTLLHEIQTKRVFDDGKTFVDLTALKSHEAILREFDLFMADHHHQPLTKDLLAFLRPRFDLNGAGSDLKAWRPGDWQPLRKLSHLVKDPLYQLFARRLHKLWQELGREIDATVSAGNSSLIRVSEPFIVPGGRFREFYYWDTYWILLGLIGPSQMHETAKGMLHNFAELVQRYGKIPNGNRLYFLKRSQPPLFPKMVDLYMKSEAGTGDTIFLRQMMPAMREEFDFWMKKRTHTITVRKKSYRIAYYDGDTDTPRPGNVHVSCR